MRGRARAITANVAGGGGGAAAVRFGDVTIWTYDRHLRARIGDLARLCADLRGCGDGAVTLARRIDRIAEKYDCVAVPYLSRAPAMHAGMGTAAARARRVLDARYYTTISSEGIERAIDDIIADARAVAQSRAGARAADFIARLDAVARDCGAICVRDMIDECVAITSRAAVADGGDAAAAVEARLLPDAAMAPATATAPPLTPCAIERSLSGERGGGCGDDGRAQIVGAGAGAASPCMSGSSNYARHLNIWLDRLQGIEAYEIADADIARMRASIQSEYARDMINWRAVTCTDVSRHLALCGLGTLNDHVPRLLKALGGCAPPVLSAESRALITRDFARIMEIYGRIFREPGNKPFYPFFIVKIIRHRFPRATHGGIDSPARLIDYAARQSYDTISKNDRIYEAICAAAPPSYDLVYEPEIE